MKITKLGHCCLLVEEGSLRILTDPGAWTTAQNEVAGIDVILITHEHQDHLHVESVQKILQNNPQANIYANKSVGKILDQHGIPHMLLEHGQKAEVMGVVIEAYGERHAHIYETMPDVVNTGYFLAGRFFYPGDAFYNLGRPVEVLALPVAGPWMKISEAIDYARAIKPKKCFPVHDGMLKITGPFHLVPQKALGQQGIEMVILKEGDMMEF